MSAALAAFFSAPPALAIIEGIGAMEMMLVAVIGLLLFGGKGLPDMARTFGKIVREFKKASSTVEAEVKRVMNEEPEDEPLPPPRPRRTAPASLPSAPVTPATTGQAKTSDSAASSADSAAPTTPASDPAAPASRIPPTSGPAA